jgi:hypothetical protein
MKMESNFLDEGRDVFINESEIKKQRENLKVRALKNF